MGTGILILVIVKFPESFSNALHVMCYPDCRKSAVYDSYGQNSIIQGKNDAFSRNIERMELHRPIQIHYICVRKRCDHCQFLNTYTFYNY